MKVLLIDDERLARVEMRRLLAAHPEVEIVGEAKSGPEALELIPQSNPDLLLLDVQMPGMTGFEMLEQLEDCPQVIFSTAYDEYAVKAFAVNALDYLVKPVVAERLDAALKKVRVRAETGRLERVFVREGEKCWLVPVGEIVLLESEGNYTRLYFRGERPLILRSLAALEERLDSAKFFRAGRKQIVNLDWVERVEAGVGGNLIVVLKTGNAVELSRRQSQRFRETLSL